MFPIEANQCDPYVADSRARCHVSARQPAIETNLQFSAGMRAEQLRAKSREPNDGLSHRSSRASLRVAYKLRESEAWEVQIIHLSLHGERIKQCDPGELQAKFRPALDFRLPLFVHSSVQNVPVVL